MLKAVKQGDIVFLERGHDLRLGIVDAVGHKYVVVAAEDGAEELFRLDGSPVQTSCPTMRAVPFKSPVGSQDWEARQQRVKCLQYIGLRTRNINNLQRLSTWTLIQLTGILQEEP